MSGLDPEQILKHVIRPALKELGDKYSTRAAEQLLMGTAIQESGLMYLKQAGGGPALGVYQMEPATHDDIWNNFLRFQIGLPLRVASMSANATDLVGDTPKADKLIWNLWYATAMARVHYYRVKEALPYEGDWAGMASYWKRYYNTRRLGEPWKCFLSRPSRSPRR